MTTLPWTTRKLWPTDIQVGPCAWGVSMCGAGHEQMMLQRPSLVVAGADDDLDVLGAVAPCLNRLAGHGAEPVPLMLGVHEPEFSRRFESQVRARMDALGVRRVDVLTLWVDQVSDLKTGDILQTMFEMRGAGVARYLGLAHQDALGIEWLAKNTAVQVLVMPYHLDHQLARYRALDAAHDYGMASVALLPSSPSSEAIRFALAESSRAMPVLCDPVPDGLWAMTDQEADAAWRAFQQDHDRPPPLPRGKPPEC